MSFKSCPIALKSIDTTALRIAAFLMALFIGAYIWSHNPLFLLPILIELLVRLGKGAKSAPLFVLSSAVASKIGLSKRLEDSAPKIFAAWLGVAITLLTLLLHPINQQSASAVASLFLLCIGAEVLFHFCVGCHIYQIIRRVNAKNNG